MSILQRKPLEIQQILCADATTLEELIGNQEENLRLNAEWYARNGFYVEAGACTHLKVILHDANRAMAQVLLEYRQIPETSDEP